MFNPSVLAEAQALATSTAERGIAINSAQESFLDNLVNLSHNSLDTQVVSMDEAGTRFERSSSYGDPELACATHTAFTDESALAVAEIASRNILVARTDALPLIGQVMEQFEQIINPDIPYAYRKRSVVPVAFHPLWSSEYVLGVGDTYADGGDAGQVPAGLILSADEEQFTNFLELTKTGLPAVDAQLANLLSGYEDEDLRRLFKDVFSGGHLPVVRGPYSLTEGWVNDQILIHVWARALADKSPSKSSHNLASYRTGLATVVERSGNNIWHINKIRSNCAEGGVIVLAYAGDTIHVHSDIYTEWLKQEGAGNCPEVVLGASLLTGQLRPATGAELTASGEALVAKWNDYVSMSSRTEQENLNAQARIELFRLIRTHVDKRLAEGLVPVYEDAMAVLNDSIERLKTNFIKDPYEPIRDIILDVFYAGTEVKMFVMAMDEIEEDDDDLEEEEIAFLAVVNYLTDWAACLLVKKSGQL
jgi:hypothetical protein